MFDLGTFAYECIYKLIINVVDKKIESAALSGIKKIKIKKRVENATLEVVESLLPFLEYEKISQEKQEHLINTCIEELLPFTRNPENLFRGSLNGQKIFENLYLNHDLPEVIIEDGLKDTYTLLFPRIATLLCKIPEAINDWEKGAWSENFRRLDDVVEQLNSIFQQVDNLANSSILESDITLIKLKKILKQKIGFQLDLTGLRADQPLSGKFDDYFVLPEFKKILDINEEIKIKNRKDLFLIEPDNFINNFTKINSLAIIYGAPGAGKSTWSKWFQRETIDSANKGFGIRVEFRNLNIDCLPTVYDLVRLEAGKQISEDLSQKIISKWIDAGILFFIFDGFDEVRQDDREKFLQWIIEIRDFTNGCPIIVTTRPLTTNHLEALSNKWTRWNVEPFDNVRVVSYITKWYSNSTFITEQNREKNPKNLAEVWLDDPIIGPLTGNPLLLSTLLMVHHLDGKLPNGRANLYKRYVDGMLGLWDDRNKLTASQIQISKEDKKQIIRNISLHLFFSEKETIEENDLIFWLSEFLKRNNIRCTPEEVLSFLRERTGLIVGPGVYAFVHKTIMEYLVAEVVLDGTQQDNDGERIDRFTLLEHRDDDRWNVVIFLWAGLAPSIDITQFIDHCIVDNKTSLALGILFDQYEKISFNNKKILIQKVNHIGFNSSSNKGWGIPGWPVGHKRIYYIPTSPIRTISDIKNHRLLSVDELYRKAIIDNVIAWRDFQLEKDKFGWLLFLLFSTTPTDGWENVLLDAPNWILNKSNDFYQFNNKQGIQIATMDSLEQTMNIPLQEWGYLVAGRAFSKWQYYEKKDLQNYFDKFTSLYPQYSCFVILNIMSSIVEISLDNELLQKENIIEYLYQCIKIIKKIKIEDIDDQYLLGTKKWFLFPGENKEQKNQDLIRLFKKSLEEIYNKVSISIEEQEKLNLFVSKLMNRRNNINKKIRVTSLSN